MASLQTQYKNFLQENPTSVLTFEEWKDTIFKQMNEIINIINDNVDENNNLDLDK
jgi:hypothetical protein